MSTPGAPLVWCFASGNETDLSVTVDRGSICIHVAGTEQIVTLGGTGELVAWLKEHRAGSLEDPSSSLIDKVKSRKLFRWE